MITATIKPRCEGLGPLIEAECVLGSLQVPGCTV